MCPLALRAHDHAEEGQRNDDQNDASDDILDIRRCLHALTLARALHTAHTVDGITIGERVLRCRCRKELGCLGGTIETLGALAIIDLQIDLYARLSIALCVQDLVLAPELRVLYVGHARCTLPAEDHVIAQCVLLHAHRGAKHVAHLAQELRLLCTKLSHIHQHDHRHGTLSQLRGLIGLLAVETIPAALGIVASIVTVTIAVMLLAVGIVNGRTTLQLLLAVASVVEARGRVALLIAFAVHEDAPALWRRAIGPRIDAQRAIVAIEVAGIRVALLIAHSVALLLRAAACLAHLALLLQVRIVFATSNAASTAHTIGIAIGHTGAHIAWIVDLATFARPLAGAEALIVAKQILTGSTLQAWIGLAFIHGVHLAMSSRCATGAFTAIAAGIVHNAHARLAGIRVTILSTVLTILAIVALGTDTVVSTLLGAAHSAILARRLCTEVHLVLTVPSHVSGPAIAVIVVHQLHAVQGACIGAGVAEALVDVTLTACTHKARWARALESADTIDAAAIVVACPRHAVIVVQFTNDAQCAGRATAAEALHQVMACAAILAGIRRTIIDVQLTVLSLEALATLALVGAHQIATGAAVLARLRGALVNVLLAIAARIALAAVADMAVQVILARAIVAQLLHCESLALCRILATDRLHVAQLSRPACSAFAIELMLQLTATGSILARRLGTPVHIVGALFTRKSAGAVASVLVPLLVASAAIETRRRIAFVQLVLTICPTVTGQATAIVTIDAVHTTASVEARTLGAILIVGLAIDATEAQWAGAGVTVHILATRGSILAGHAQALVDVRLAVFAIESIDTEARVVTNAVQTCATILARERGAIIRIDGTISALVTLRAEATIRAGHIEATGAIAARRTEGTLIDILVTVASRVAQLAGA